MRKEMMALSGATALFLLLSCSDDEPAPALPEDEIVLELSALANTGTDIVQLDLRTDAPEPVFYSLGETFDLQFLENARNQFDSESIAYYTWEDQQSRIYFKDLRDGSILTESDICGFSSESDFPKQIQGIWGDRDNVAMAYRQLTQNGLVESRLRLYSRLTGSCTDFSFSDVGPQGIREILLSEGIAILFYNQAGTGQPVLSLIDLDSNTSLTNLNLSEDFLAACLRDKELLLFGRDQTFRIFNTTSLTFGSETEIPGFPLLSEGLFETRFEGAEILVRYIYQQPSLFFSQPALYDLSTGTFAEGGQPFLPALQNRIEADLSERFLFGNFDADPLSGRIAISYVQGDGSPQGGIVICDFRGNPIQIIPLPVVPERIVIRSVSFP